MKEFLFFANPLTSNKVRAKISRMGDKVHILIPKAYHKDVESLVNQFVDVEILNRNEIYKKI
jgi:hypothetical protein